MPIDLEIQNISHRFGNVEVLRNVALQLENGEFVTFLGPSGCGKTTLLRIIAGFLHPSEGRVVLSGREITGVPPHKRPVNMVFQRPTLFPHLDVRGNIAFGLRLERLSRSEIARRVEEALALVRLSGLERRRATELSGGQMQRVALARAMVKRPQILLLDEPLSALDLAVRLEMEAELRRVHRETGATFVSVTHDQREALALSDRVAVFESGQLIELATPEALFRSPQSEFAARFVGGANLLPVEVTRKREAAYDVVLRGVPLEVPEDADAPVRDSIEPGPAWLMLRPQAVRLVPSGTNGQGGPQGIVADLAYRGTTYTYSVAIDEMAEPLMAEIAVGAHEPIEVGDRVEVRWEPGAARLVRSTTVTDLPGKESST